MAAARLRARDEGRLQEARSDRHRGRTPNVLNDGTNQLLTQTPFVNQQTGRFDVSILKQFIDAYRKAEASNNSQQLDRMRPAYNYWLFVEKNLRTQLLARSISRCWPTASSPTR